jgi:LytR cell envelope-related transcriptional attenuator
VRSGRHAAADGSFGRSAGANALRGAGLLVVAVVLGVILLNRTDSGNPFDQPVVAGSSRGSHTTTTVALPVETTTTTAPLRPPAQVKVLAANGTSVKGLAGQVKDKLTAAGYNALAPTDTSAKPVVASAVYFTAGFDHEAAAVAVLLGLPATAVKPMPAPPPVAALQGANVLVVIGQDRAPATTTTVHRATSTSTTVHRSTTTTKTPSATTTTRA